MSRTIPGQGIHSQEPLPVEVARYWNKLLAPYMRSSYGKAFFQLFSTLALYALGWYLMYRSLAVSYWLTLLIALPTTGFLIRLFIFQHDCGHGSFFPSRKANDVAGFFLGVLMLTPYKYWRRTHAIHHGGSGDLDRRSFGDIETLTVEEYLALSPGKRLGYRVYRNLFVLLAIGPAFQFLIKHRFPYDIPRSWKREWSGVMWTNLVALCLFLVGWKLVGLKSLLMVQLPITLMAGAGGMWLFYIQHQFEDTYWERHEDWSFHKAGIEGSSFYDLGPILHWFTGNIGYHHIHHLASRVPNYKLRKCYKDLPELHEVTVLSIPKSFHCATLKLWDEEIKTLVSFRHLKTVKA